MKNSAIFTLFVLPVVRLADASHISQRRLTRWAGAGNWDKSEGIAQQSWMLRKGDTPRTPRCFPKFWDALRLALLALVLLLLVQAAPPVWAQNDSPLLFVENVGQFPDANIRFQVNMGQTTLTLADNALWLTVIKPPRDDGPNVEPLDAQSPDSPADRGVNLKLTFVDANPAPQLEPFDPLDTPISYFVGSSAAGWQGQVPVWGGVRYTDLYPGLDLELSGQDGQLTPRLVVKNKAGLDALAGVQLRIEGAEAISLDNIGVLRLATPLGDIALPLLQLGGLSLDQPPPPPQIEGQTVIAPFATAPPQIAASAQVSIAAAGDLIYSTFIGGNNYFDSSQDIVIDEAGHAYITGRAYTGFPSTPGVFDPTIEGFFNDAFIAKLTPDGSGLVYATFLGGSAGESAQAIAIDDAGNAYVCGYTGSADFPVTPGAFDDSLATAQDSFVAKLNPTGTALLYATYLGGNADDWARDLVIDAEGHAFVTGDTRSTNFPTTPGALASGYQGGFDDGFVVKLAADGGSLLYGTFLGGSEAESSYGVAVDSEGNAYVTGYTGSADFPTTPGALDTTFTSADAFVVKLNSAGSALVYGTFIGGNMAEGGFAIALGDDGSAFVTGRTDSPDFPVTPDAFDTGYSFASNDGFVAKLSPAGDALYYATYLGGNNEEEGRDVVVDEAGNAYVTGATYSSNFPVTSDAFDPTCPSCSLYLSAFVAKLNPTGTALIYGSYLGGETDHDQAYGLAQDGAGNVYISGQAQSSDFPTTPGAFDTVSPNYAKAFVSKLFIGTASAPPPPLLPMHTCGPQRLDTFTVQSQPRGLAIDPTRQRLYVANFGSNSVSVVDTRNDEVLQNIPDIESANGVAYDPTQNIIWVSNTSANQLTPIQANDDATDFTVFPPVAVGAGPWGVAYDPVHNYVVVANSGDSTVSVVDAAAQSLVATLSGSFNQPRHLAANSLSGKVYVANTGQNSVTVINGTTVSKVVQVWDSGRPYGIAVDEMRNVIYVATVETNRIVAIGPLNGQPDQFLGWASFQRGYNPNRRVPLRAIAVNPQMGPSGDGGHVWATTSTGDGSEANQALLIPKGWSSRFHVPYVQNVGNNPTEGIAIDRTTNRVYISSSGLAGLVTVLGDHPTICNNVGIAGTSRETAPVTFEVYSVEKMALSDLNSDGRVDIFDLTLVATHFGSSDSTADLNGDGRVDIFDLTIVAGSYGQALPGSE